MKCSSVIHMVVPVWQNGNSREEDYLGEAVWNALSLAAEKNYARVALTGVASYPASAAAKIVLEVTVDFCQSSNSPKLTEICLIDINDSVVNHFHEGLLKVFGKETVRIVDLQGRKAVSEVVPLGQTDLCEYNNFIT